MSTTRSGRWCFGVLRLSLCAVLLSGLLSACGREEAEAWSPPEPSAQDLFDLGQPIDDFALVDADGRTFTRADLLGKVWVVDFFFTSCGSVCPRMTEDLRSLAARIRDLGDVHFLSISVDPLTDTPEVLRAYAEKFRADRSRWIFATGAERQILELAENSFLSPIGEKLEDGQVPHTERFLILDRRAHLRSSRDRLGGADVVAHSEHDVRLLVQEPAGAEAP